MEEQLQDGTGPTEALAGAGSVKVPTDHKSPIDPLRRVWIPIERRTSGGTLVFKTHDKQAYARLEDGSIRRVLPKINGKEARKTRARARAQER